MSVGADQQDEGRPYRGRSLAARRADRRERFLDAGLELFGTIGFARVTISALCAEAGLSRRQFYEEFSGSEELLIELNTGIQQEARRRVVEAVLASDLTDVEATTRVAVSAYFQALATDLRLVRCSFIELGGISEAVELHRHRAQAEWATYIEQMLAMLPGTSRVSLDYGSTALIGAFSAVMHRWVVSDPRPDCETVIDLMTRLLLQIARA